MKIQIASDLHLEYFENRFGDGPTLPYADGADVLVLAGDIAKQARGIAAFSKWPVPVIYVHGNHEHYRAHIWQTIEKLRLATNEGNTHYLEKDEWFHQGVRFLGCCLWTDYDLYGDSVASMARAENALNDHRLIRTHRRTFLPVDARIIHLGSRAWLEEKLAEPFDGKTVVITHHGPHPESVEEAYQGDPLTPAFVSDLSPLMGAAALWIHGHVHGSLDYVVNGTRVIANPRGYPIDPRRAKELAAVKYENEQFQPALLVEI